MPLIILKWINPLEKVLRICTEFMKMVCRREYAGYACRIFIFFVQNSDNPSVKSLKAIAQKARLTSCSLCVYRICKMSGIGDWKNEGKVRPSVPFGSSQRTCVCVWIISCCGSRSRDSELALQMKVSTFDISRRTRERTLFTSWSQSAVRYSTLLADISLSKYRQLYKAFVL